MSDSQDLSTQMVRVRVGCEFVFESPFPTPTLVQVRARDDYANHRLLDERWTVVPELPVGEYVDGFGNRVTRLTTPAGPLRMRYDALAAVLAAADPVLPGLLKTPVEALPDEVLVYTLPSRHCPSDLFIDDAWRLFGHIDTGWEQAQAVCDWLHANITYGKGSTASTSAWEAYGERRGVCRDFAHLGVAFCRALNIPARYACGYLPDIGVTPEETPMDFHAWFEAYLEGGWRTFDARHNRPRAGRVLIAYGRDAVDAAWATTFGSAQLMSMRVWADEVEQGVVLDDRPLAALAPAEDQIA